LKRPRKLIHSGCSAVEESIKWSCPHFIYHGMLCSMAAFKEHCTFGFWKGKLMKSLATTKNSAQGMGQNGRMTSLSMKTAEPASRDLATVASSTNF
jgi:hypothetical protein